MSSRSYRQHCGMARALDLVGERWSLLVIRELMLGPRRFGDLVENLPGIGTNLLSARLKALDEAGVVRRTTLPPPASVPAYELTERGEGLRPVLEELALWGFELLPEIPEAESATRASWAALSMATVLERSRHAGLRGTFEFAVGDERFHVVVRGGRARVRQGVAASADVSVRMDPMTFFGLASGQLTLTQALRAGGVQLEGDRRELERLLRGFHLPERAAA